MTAGFSVNAQGYDACALVVLSNQTDLPWVRLLRPGFRHCFVVVRRQGQWVAVDPLMHRTRIDLLANITAEALARRYRHHGLRVVKAAVAHPHRHPAPLAPFTCVEAVKRVLGIHARFVLTPWQLYRYLCRRD